MKGIKTFLIIILVPVLLLLTLFLLCLGIVLIPFLGIILILISGKIRKVNELAKTLRTDFRHAAFAWIILSNIPLNKLLQLLRALNRIVVIGDFPQEKTGVLLVSNHPSWIDQVTIFQFIISYLGWLKNPDCFPFIGAARDSIIKLPFLKALEMFYIVTAIERHNMREMPSLVAKMGGILTNGNNLVISGPAGRDFKRTEKEIIESPIKKKPLRRFGWLCGRLGILGGVTTVPVYIEGTEKLFVFTKDGKNMKFSAKQFLFDYLLLGRFQIIIVFGESLVLQGLSRKEAREKIEKEVLRLADFC